MKALKIYETLHFEKGGDPYKKLQIGDVYREIKIGDKFKFNKCVYYAPSNDGDGLYLTTTGRDNPLIYKNEKTIIEHNNNESFYTLSFKKNNYAIWDIVPITKKKLRDFLENNIISRIK